MQLLVSDPEDGFTPLHYAMLDGDAAALAAALAAGAEVDAQDELGVAPLLSAVATDECRLLNACFIILVPSHAVNAADPTPEINKE